MLDKPKMMYFQEGGGNLVVTIDDIGANWKSKPQDNYKVSSVHGSIFLLVLKFTELAGTQNLFQSIGYAFLPNDFKNNNLKTKKKNRGKWISDMV
jgi:hypothetical protein